MKPLARLSGLLPFFFFALIFSLVEPVYAACTSPAGNEGDQIYNNDYHTWQFCNGSGWMKFGGGASCTASGGSAPATAPSRSGYFVISGTTWDGSFGGSPPADAKCLTELTVTNTSWAGYATANSNGQLVASKVHAFLCDGNVCNSLMPLTTYYFANATNAGAGGASFTTDALGNGPQDSASWSAANHFSGTYTYWTDVGTQSSTLWSSSVGGGATCGNYTVNFNLSSGYTGTSGTSNSTTSTRWASNFSTDCSVPIHLICFVNP